MSAFHVSSTSTLSTPSRRRTRRGWVGRGLAQISAGALVVAAFLPWTDEGVTALVLGLRSLGEGAEQPTVALTLVALAAVAAIPTLVDDFGLPRLLAGGGAVALAAIVVILGAGEPTAAGALTALAGGIALVATAAIATGGPPAADGGQVEGRRTTPLRGGFDHLDHTADTAFRAWGPTRAACFAAAVRGLVDSFVDLGDATPDETYEVELPPASDEDILVDLLSEVIYVLDVRRGVPVGGLLRDTAGGGLTGRFDLVPTGRVTLSSAVPKAITYHALEVIEGDDGVWRCRVTIDV